MINTVQNVGDAAVPLQRRWFDLLLVDERLPGPPGSELIADLKQGRYGERNAETAFIMVTGNPQWPPRDLRLLQGYLGIARKGGCLTPEVQTVIDSVREEHIPPRHERLRRVIARVVACEEDGSWVDLLVPSWNSTTRVRVERRRLPGTAYVPHDQLVGSHYFAWMNVDAETADDVDITHFRPEIKEEDADGEHLTLA